MGMWMVLLAAHVLCKTCVIQTGAHTERPESQDFTLMMIFGEHMWTHTRHTGSKNMLLFCLVYRCTTNNGFLDFNMENYLTQNTELGIESLIYWFLRNKGITCHIDIPPNIFTPVDKRVLNRIKY